MFVPSVFSFLRRQDYTFRVFLYYSYCIDRAKSLKLLVFLNIFPGKNVIEFWSAKVDGYLWWYPNLWQLYPQIIQKVLECFLLIVMNYNTALFIRLSCADEERIQFRDFCFVFQSVSSMSSDLGFACT